MTPTTMSVLGLFTILCAAVLFGLAVGYLWASCESQSRKDVERGLAQLDAGELAVKMFAEANANSKAAASEITREMREQERRDRTGPRGPRE